MIELILAGLLLAAVCIPASALLARWSQADPLLWGILVLSGTIVGTAGLVHVSHADASIDSIVLVVPYVLPEGLRFYLDGLAGIGLTGVGLAIVAAALLGFGWGRYVIGDRHLRPTGAALPLFALAASGGMVVPLAADAWTLGAGMGSLLLAYFAAGPAGMVADTEAVSAGENSHHGTDTAAQPATGMRGRLLLLLALAGALIAGGAAGASVAAGGPAAMGLSDLGLDFDLIRSGMLPIDPAATVPAALAVVAGLAGVAIVVIACGRGMPPALALLGTSLALGLSGILCIRLLIDLLGPSMLPRQLALVGSMLLVGGAGLALLSGCRAVTTVGLDGLTAWSRGAALAAVPSTVGLALLLRGHGLTAAAVETVTAVLLAAGFFGLAQGLAAGCAGLVTASVGTDRFDRFGGGLDRLPLASAGLILAAGAGIGLPLLAGFVPLWLAVQGGIAAMQLPDTWMRLLVVGGGAVFAAGWLMVILGWLRAVGLACLGPARGAWPSEPADADGAARLMILASAGTVLVLGVLPVLATGLAVPVIADLLGAPARAADGLSGWLAVRTAAGGGLSMGMVALLAMMAIGGTLHVVWRLQLNRPIRLGLRSEAPWMDGRVPTTTLASVAAEPPASAMPVAAPPALLSLPEPETEVEAVGVGRAGRSGTADKPSTETVRGVSPLRPFRAGQTSTTGPTKVSHLGSAISAVSRTGDDAGSMAGTAAKSAPAKRPSPVGSGSTQNASNESARPDGGSAGGASKAKTRKPRRSTAARKKVGEGDPLKPQAGSHDGDVAPAGAAISGETQPTDVRPKLKTGSGG